MNSTSTASKIFPSAAVLELTYACNHNCFFCCLPWEAPDSLYPVRDELKVSDWESIVDTCIDNGVTVFSLSGGEPTLKQGFEKLIRYIRKQLGPRNAKTGHNRIHMTTNGSTFNASLLEVCRENDVTLSLSLPGLETYEAHTGRNGAVQILKSIKQAAQSGISCTAGITLTRMNLTEVYETAGQALLAGATDLYINRFLPGGRGLNHTDQLLSVHKLWQAMTDVDMALQHANRAGAMGTEIPKCCLPNKPLKKLQVSSGCAAAKNFFVVDPSGYIRVCTHSPFPIAHACDFASLPENSYWRSFVLGENHPDECSACPERRNCAGGCREAAHVFSGDVRATDPLISWKR